MKNKILWLPFVALIVSIGLAGVSMVKEMDSVGGVPIEPKGFPVFLSILFCVSFVACQLAVPIISRINLKWGYVAISAPYIFMLFLMGILLMQMN